MACHSGCSDTTSKTSDSTSFTCTDTSSTSNSCTDRTDRSCRRRKRDDDQTRPGHRDAGGCRDPCGGTPVILSRLPDCVIPTCINDETEDTRRPQHNYQRHHNHCCSESSHSTRQGSMDSFRVILTPVSMLNSICSGASLIEFKIRRKNRVITLQWEPFECSISQSGVAALSVQQVISQLPPYPIKFPIIITYNGRPMTSFISVDPNSQIQIKFHLNLTGSGTQVAVGDHVSVPGSCVSWITDY